MLPVHAKQVHNPSGLQYSTTQDATPTYEEETRHKVTTDTPIVRNARLCDTKVQSATAPDKCLLFDGSIVEIFPALIAKHERIGRKKAAMEAFANSDDPLDAAFGQLQAQSERDRALAKWERILRLARGHFGRGEAGGGKGGRGRGHARGHGRGHAFRFSTVWSYQGHVCHRGWAVVRVYAVKPCFSRPFSIKLHSIFDYER